MKKLTSLASLALSIIATASLTLGFGAFAAKVDPVSGKAKEISSSDTGTVAGLPCAPCSGGGDGDPVDRTSSSRELA